MKAFPDPNAFEALYPETPGKLRHGLVDHPLLRLESLVALAARMRPGTVEYNRGNLPVGVAPDDRTIGNGLSVADTIRGIATNGSWMVLKWVEQDEAYRALLDAALDELAPVVSARTGPMLKREAFVFVSSPGSVTPFHFDPEHNILLQIRGHKTMTIWSPGDDAVAPPEEHERFHAGGHRNLPWRDDFAGKGQAFDLAPGEGVHVPVKAPHWVRNGDAVSISLSVTWRSGWSFAEADARAMNRLLRRSGLAPASPPRWPRSDARKAYAWRALRRLGVRQ